MVGGVQGTSHPANGPSRHMPTRRVHEIVARPLALTAPAPGSIASMPTPRSASGLRSFSPRWTGPQWLGLLWLAFAVLVTGCVKPPPNQAGDDEGEGTKGPVELDLWAGVPPLERKEGDLKKVLAPKAGPKKPEQVGVEIDAPFPPEAPPTGTGTLEKPDGPLKVLRHGPEGNRGLIDALRVSFNHPMVPLATIETLEVLGAPMQIEPKPPGEFRWMGTKTVAFYPEGRLPFSTTYTITVPADEAESTFGTKLEKDFSWTVTTPELALSRSTPWRNADHVSLDTPIVLVFNQPIKREALAKAVTLKGGGKTVPVKLVPEAQWSELKYGGAGLSGGEDWQKSRALVLQPEQELSPNTSYTVSIPKGNFGEGPNDSPAFTTSFRTYPPLSLSVQRCNGEPCSASYGIGIQATNSIQDPKIDSRVHVSPEVPGMRVRADWRGIHLDGDFEGLKTYTITVDEGLRDTYGQTLKKTWTAKVTTGPLQPELRVFPRTSHPGIIEASAGHTVQLRVAGISSVDLHSVSFDDDDLDTFLDWNGRVPWDKKWPTEVTKHDHHQVFSVADSRRKAQTITINVDELVTGKNPFVYFTAVSDEFTRPGYSWPETLRIGQIVQLTDLGVSAAFDRDDGVVLVTSLSTGAVVPGAQVKVLRNDGRNEVWTGLTDDKGVARPKLGTSQVYEGWLAVSKGDDEMTMPLSGSDARQQWMGYLLGQTRDDNERAFFFTDRQPYKPGEKVHLVGVIRKETRGPEGGVEPWGRGMEGKYTVTTNRGVKVQEGEVEIGPFGLFSLDIETEPDGDTGNYQFQVTFDPLLGSSKTFYHSFAVETYRTPEFEVKVERDESAPLFYGDELAAKVEGHYLFGAPLVGGEVQYTLERSDGGFRPPAEGLSGFTFGEAQRWGWYRPSYATRVVKRGSGTLDVEGAYEVSHALHQIEPPPPGTPEPPKDPDAEPPTPKAATFTLNATVTDENRQAIAGSASFVVHPSALYVGLRSERSVLREGESTKVEAAVVDVDGKRVSGRAIELKAIRKETTRKAVEKNGVWTFDYDTVETEVSSCDLSSADAPVSCQVTVGEPGTHEVVAVVEDAEGRKNESKIELYVHGDDDVIWDKEQRRVDLVPDVEEYEPGDTAKLLVRSPFQDARGWLVIEREGIAHSVPLHVQGGAQVVEVPIAPAWIGGVNASAVLVSARQEVKGVPSDQDLGMPAQATGQVTLKVSTATKKIDVKVEPERDQIAPKEKLKVDVRTLDHEGKPVKAAVALMVVDEGVLSLMGYQTPDPLSFFHYQRSGETGLFASHGYVLPRDKAEQPVPVPEPDAAQPTVPMEDEADDVWGGLTGSEVGEAYGVGGLGLVGTGRGGGGTGEGTIGLGNTGLIGKGGGGGSGSGYGRGAGTSKSSPRMKRASKPSSPMKMEEKSMADEPAPAPSAAPGGAFAGGIDTETAMAQEVSLRTLFATTAYFDPNVRTDASGRATVEIDMPENLTSFRIMAVAIDPEVLDRFGSAEASVRVRKPIMLRPSLPRFLNLGDEFEASVMVDNQTDEELSIMVGTRALHVQLTGTKEETLQIPAGESKEVRFPMKADRVGTVRVQFAALSNLGRDAAEIELPVNLPATKQAFADYGMTDDSTSRAIIPPKDALAGFGGLELSFSSTALNGLEDAVDYLVTYPYECTEQTASRLIPIFALGKVLDDFPIAAVHDKARRKLLADEGLEKLYRHQHWDGGFTYWGDNNRHESWPYLTTWVTLALLEGKKAGFAVDEEVLAKANNYLENYVRNGIETRWGVYYDWSTRAFAVYLLSRQNRGSDLFAKVWAKRDRIPLYGRAMLMSAAHRYGKTAERDEVMEELRNAVVENARTIHFAESRTEAASDGLRLLMHSDVQTRSSCSRCSTWRPRRTCCPRSWPGSCRSVIPRRAGGGSRPTPTPGP